MVSDADLNSHHGLDSFILLQAVPWLFSLAYLGFLGTSAVLFRCCAWVDNVMRSEFVGLNCLPPLRQDIVAAFMEGGRTR